MTGSRSAELIIYIPLCLFVTIISIPDTCTITWAGRSPRCVAASQTVQSVNRWICKNSSKERRYLDLGDGLNLVEVVPVAFAQVTAVVVHRVRNGARTFEELGRGEPLLVERLDSESVKSTKMEKRERMYLVITTASLLAYQMKSHAYE